MRKYGLTYGMFNYYRDKLVDDEKFEKAMEHKRPGPATKITNELV